MRWMKDWKLLFLIVPKRAETKKKLSGLAFTFTDREETKCLSQHNNSFGTREKQLIYGAHADIAADAGG